MSELTLLRQQIGASDFFEFYNQIEQKVLFDEVTGNEQSNDKNVKKFKQELMENQLQAIKELGMSLTRQDPTAWNEFMIVALGMPEDQPLPGISDEPEQVTQNNES